MVGASAVLGPYPDPAARDQRVHELAEAAGGRVFSLGTSVEGRPILAARLPGPEADAPRILCTANIHGPEFAACHVALALLAAAANPDPALAELLARAHLVLVPCLNPDGYARTHARAGQGSLADLRPNARGVDLNRNYPLPPGAVRRRLPGAGSRRPGAATYVGASPLSEPETAAMANLCGQERFWASANLHSFMGAVIPAHTRNRRQYRAYCDLARAFRRAQTDHRYRRLSSRYLDTFTGEQEDYQHHHHDTWAVCVETFPLLASYGQHLLAPSLFWRFNPRDPDRWASNDVPALVAFFLAALNLPRPSALGPVGAAKTIPD